MNFFELIFLLACAWVLAASVYLTMARCYATGVFGSIGFCLMALSAFHYLVNWYMEGFIESSQTRLMMVGMALLLVQHVFRVYVRAKADRRKTISYRRVGMHRRGDGFRLVNRQ